REKGCHGAHPRHLHRLRRPVLGEDTAEGDICHQTVGRQCLRPSCGGPRKNLVIPAKAHCCPGRLPRTAKPPCRHSGAGRNPVHMTCEAHKTKGWECFARIPDWIPAFAGMTEYFEVPTVPGIF